MNIKKVSLVRDSLWTMIGLISMNGVAQFVVYPFLRRLYGIEEYGRILTMLAVVNLTGITVGTGLNNVRLVAFSKGKGLDNTPYLQFLAVVSIFVFGIGAAVFTAVRGYFKIWPVILYSALIMLTVLKYYSEVEYRLHTNYKGLLIYYLVISAGYLVGMGLLKTVGEWSISLLTGETFGFVLVVIFGTIYRQTDNTEQLGSIWKSARYLIMAQLIVNLVFNSDRFILMPLCGSSAVTIFYIACAVGKMISLLTGAFNSVIIGYLAKKKESISLAVFRKLFVWITGIVFVLSVGCLVGSALYVHLLYPDDYELARPFFYPANLGQVFYFASGIFTTILLRYENEKIQTQINILYMLIFIAIAVGASYLWGIWGYTIGILAANILRYLYAAYLCGRRIYSLEGETG